MDDRHDSNIKTFNAAKKFAEEILFPLMQKFQNFQSQSDFGCINLNESILLTEEMREIQRYNGLKAMNEICLSLAIAIKSTVKLKGNKEEMDALENILDYLEKTKTLFYEKRNNFFKEEYKNGRIEERLEREYFEKIKKIIQTCYVNTEMLMTRNKLLFSDASDEFKSDEEIMDSIKKEYSEG